jgi:hypothetical protein
MYQATLLKLNPLMEEEVLLDINGVKLVGFSTICPYKIVPGNVYFVRLYLIYLDGVEVNELDNQEYGAIQVDDTYKYFLKGRVIGSYLDIGNGIKIKEEYFEKHPYLNGKYVMLKIDRFGVEFLSKI